MALTELPEQREALPQAVVRLLISPHPFIHGPEVAKIDGLAAAVAEGSIDGQAVPQTGDRLWIPPQPLVHPAEVPQAGRLPLAVAARLGLLAWAVTVGGLAWSLAVTTAAASTTRLTLSGRAVGRYVAARRLAA